MGRAFFLLIVAFLFIFLDWYTYNGLQSMFFHTRYVKLWKILYALVSGFTYLSIFYLMYSYSPGNTGQRNEYLNLMGGFVFTMFVTKMVFGGFLLLQDTGRLVYGGFQYVKFKLSDDVWSEDSFIPGRRMFLTSFATIAAGLPFFSLLFGITKGKYLYTVEKKVLSFKDLPDEFEGFNIVQISDIHAGSFDNKEKVRKGIDMINELNADVVCFTGDLVNSEKEEIDPYIDVFADIKAKYGKFAILGNHDYYGSYDRTRPEGEKLYFEDFYKKYEKMGFTLLNNQHQKVFRNESSINIIGVENWGAGRWFPKKGDLDTATEGISTNEFNVLLSHDPTHWDEKVKDYDKHIHLTLSGHTHGFQFGFQMPGFAWSPAQYRYKKWMGLYEENGKNLYINKGFGFLGFPGRVGMWPEITLIELRKA
ncbi:MAG: metallophosphoesterase [Saprospiraceae bacterium]|nr:metallophosphoesterase [Saprospiraceae bacterium]